VEYWWHFTKEANAQARQMSEKATGLDPQYAAAYALLSGTHWFDWFFQWSSDPQSLERAFELAQTPDPVQRAKLQNLLAGFVIYPVTEEMRELARSYINTGVFTPVMFNDALHVAAAVLTRQDILVSWNFRHLVNRRRRAKVNEVNISLGLPTIEIVAPPEI